jgi:hypothetical protein
VDPQKPTGGAGGWVWGLLGGALTITLFAGGGLWLLSSAGDGEPAAAGPVAPTSSAPTPSAASHASVAATSEPPATRAQCWDGSTASTVDACSLPDGPSGLAWLFPQLPGQTCRPPRPAGVGVVVRVLCSATLSDGTRVKAGYYQWESVAAADAYYDGQPLRRTDGNGFHGWRARLGHRIKKAVLYDDAPYSRTLLYRTSASGTAELGHLRPRPPGHVRGEPVG